MKISINILWLIVFSAAISACSNQSEMDTKPPRLEEAPPQAEEPLPKPELLPEPPHPLSVEGMVLAEYEARLISHTRTQTSEDFTTSLIEYKFDGLKLRALLRQPSGNPPSGGFPVIVLAHGHYILSAWNSFTSYQALDTYYASRGFAVVKPDYRGHGESEGREEAGALLNLIDYARDVIALTTLLNNIEELNTQNLFLVGHSNGGDIALRILETTDIIKGASIWASAFTTFQNRSAFYGTRRSGRTEEEAIKAFEDAFRAEYPGRNIEEFTAIRHLERIKVPLIIHHGTDDTSAPIQWTYDLNQGLTQAGVDYKFYEYSGADHNFSQVQSRVKDRDLAFFRKLMEPSQAEGRTEN